MKMDRDLPRALEQLRELAKGPAKHDSIIDHETMASFETMRTQDQVEFLLRLLAVMVHHSHFLEEKIDVLMEYASEQIIEKQNTNKPN